MNELVDNPKYGEAVDAWIDAIIEVGEGRNNPCPCGCGKKQKKVDLEEHEKAFIEKFMAG